MVPDPSSSSEKVFLKPPIGPDHSDLYVPARLNPGQLWLQARVTCPATSAAIDINWKHRASG
jgi:hypothetical protein